MSLFTLINEITEDIKSAETEKREEYMKYIEDHINNVKSAFMIFVKINWDENLISKSDILTLQYRVNNHDQSKYSDEEFEPYRKKFFSVNDKECEDCEEEFEEAWEHHYMCNDHHPEYWIKDGVPSEMSIPAICEMICDWQGMAFAKGGSALSYYNSIKDTENDKVLASTTREILENILEIYDAKLTEIALTESMKNTMNGQKD